MRSLIQTTLQAWFRRPIRTASLLALIWMLVCGGPGACMIHCLLLVPHHMAQHAQQHHASATDHHVSDGVLCTSIEQHTQHHDEVLPSALTVAIMLPLLLLPLLRITRFQTRYTILQIFSFALAPHHPPPRLLPS